MNNYTNYFKKIAFGDDLLAIFSGICYILSYTIKKYRSKYEVKIYHYVLMPNHVHMIVEANPKPLVAFMHGGSLSYAQWFQKKYSRIGHFWQDRYKSHIIEKETYLLKCSRYIELNPVRANIVTKPEDYKYSSYNFYAFGKQSDILIHNPIYLTLDSNRQNQQCIYREFVGKGIHENLEIKENYFLGSDEFIKQIINNELKHRIKPRKSPSAITLRCDFQWLGKYFILSYTIKRGRPRKNYP